MLLPEDSDNMMPIKTLKVLMESGSIPTNRTIIDNQETTVSTVSTVSTLINPITVTMENVQDPLFLLSF